MRFSVSVVVLVASSVLVACGDDTGGSSSGSGGGDAGSGGAGGAGAGGAAATTTTQATGTQTATTGGGNACPLAESNTGDPAIDACAEDACCTELALCQQEGGDWCERVDSCIYTECRGGLCGTGGTLDGGGAQDACMEENCCPQVVECFGASGETIEACTSCIVDGGGALCDAYLECAYASCF